jgi:hypothetical protein
MSFLERAKQAATQAAEQARQTTGRAEAMLADPTTAEKAKGALLKARRGLSTAIDRIDPSVLADVIIKATALQEKANAALKAKGSPYRIGEISIGAAIPPSVSFGISRVDDPEAEVLPELGVASSHLVEQLALGEDAVLALDGSTVDPSLAQTAE